MKKRISDEEKIKIQDYHQHHPGITLSSMCIVFKFSDTTIRKILKENLTDARNNMFAQEWDKVRFTLNPNAKKALQDGNPSKANK